MQESSENKRAESMQREGADFALPAKYKILQVIGQGGMGIVLKVVDQQLERELAIKLLLFEGSTESTAQARFMREAKSLATLNHPNIVKLLSFDVNEKGQPYMVMEYLDGFPLSKLPEGELQFSTFLEFFASISSALAHAHESGIVHRDLKPGNIMICKTDAGLFPKIIDFGIARSDDEQGDSGKLTRTTNLVGTPAYMSPEQCSGQAIDSRSDIYSLGCVMYEVLSGRPPFQEETALQTLHAVLHSDFIHLEKSAESKETQAIAKLIDSCLSRDPAGRPSGAREIANQLEIIRQSQTSNNSPARIKLQQRATRNRVLPALVSILVLGLLITGVVFVSQKSQQNKPKPNSIIQHASTESEKHSEEFNTFKRKFATYSQNFRVETDPERRKELAHEAYMVGRKLSTSYLVNEMYDEALQVLDSMQPFVNNLDAPELISSMVQSDKSNIYYNQGNHLKAREHADKALDLLVSSDNQDNECACDPLCELARLNLRSGDLDLALNQYKKARQILLNDIGFGKAIYKKATSLELKSDDSRCGQAIELFEILQSMRQLPAKQKVRALEFRVALLEYLVFRESLKVERVAKDIKEYMDSIPPATPGFAPVAKHAKEVLATVPPV